ncbi:hypothetical protein FB451DRAFT_1187403 [Mycena latifolia]|nr:hypothetical protein FB451DRAFT_1187403 [Mycena latifolia]
MGPCDTIHALRDAGDEAEPAAAGGAPHGQGKGCGARNREKKAEDTACERQPPAPDSLCARDDRVPADSGAAIAHDGGGAGGAATSSPTTRANAPEHTHAHNVHSDGPIVVQLPAEDDSGGRGTWCRLRDPEPQLRLRHLVLLQCHARDGVPGAHSLTPESAASEMAQLCHLLREMEVARVAYLTSTWTCIRVVRPVSVALDVAANGADGRVIEKRQGLTLLVISIREGSRSHGERTGQAHFFQDLAEARGCDGDAVTMRCLKIICIVGLDGARWLGWRDMVRKEGDFEEEEGAEGEEGAGAKYALSPSAWVTGRKRSVDELGRGIRKRTLSHCDTS